MLGSMLRGLISTRISNFQYQSKCKYCYPGKYWVRSEEFDKLDAFCMRDCILPRFPKGKVTVYGAGSDIGRITCLFLKQQNVVKTIAMYDINPNHKVIGHATDLAHIDTSTAVQAYQGMPYVKQALDNTDLVVICGGHYVTPPCCNILDRDLFMQNLGYVRTAAMAIAQFAPHAMIAVQTPPVDCNFALVKYTMKLNHVYEKRHLLGVNAVNSMRANQLYAQACKGDPADSFVPVVCGTGRCTRVPVFSSTTNFWCITPDEKRFITQMIRESDDLICRVKSNYEQGHLSIGFATARFAVNIMKGLYEKPTFIDSALVDQEDPERVFKMKSFASPVIMGPDGIDKYVIPKFNTEEVELVEASKMDLEDMLNLGKCYALGDEYFIHAAKCVPVCPCFQCPEGKPEQKSES